MATVMWGERRDLIEQIRKVNKMLSLYVLTLQEETALAEIDQDGLVRAVRSMADAIEARPAQRVRRPLVIEGRVGDEAKPDGTTTEV